MPLAGIYRKAASPLWLEFAEQVVEKAGILDEETAQVLTNAFSLVPRDLFVPRGLELAALNDEALPIGFGQTISKPSLIARMLGLIGLRPGMKVLEIGCGSGYVSALMAAAGAHVFAVETVGLLAQKTRKFLDANSFQNVIILRGNGRRGWVEHGPYDGIVVSTVFDSIDPELAAQIRNPGGRMVAPVGDAQSQVLTLWEAKVCSVMPYQLETCDFNEGN